jgi:ABC-type sulfate/molybdate transport systems ATPase subunit
MAVMELEPLAERQAQNLSAGQKRRLGLARLAGVGPACVAPGRADGIA